MRKSITVAVLAAVIIAAGIAAAADGATKPSVHTRVIHGPMVDVAPFGVTDVGAYRMRCPRGYVLTGVGELLGANELVYADPDPGGRGAEFSFANPSDTDTFSSAGVIVCATGNRALKVSASSVVNRRELVQQVRSRLR